MSEDSASAPSHCLRCIGPCTCATPLLHVVRRYALHHSRAGLADNLGSLGSLESPSLAAPGTPGLLDEPGSQPEPVEQGLVDASGPALDLSDLFIGDESCGEGLSDFEGFGSLREGSPVPREHSVLGVGTGFSPSEEDGHAAVPEFEFSGSPNFVVPTPKPSPLKGRPDIRSVVEQVGLRVVDPASHLRLPWETGIYKGLFENFPALSGVPSFTVPPAPFSLQIVPSEPMGSSPARPGPSVAPCKALRAFRCHHDIAYEARIEAVLEKSCLKLVGFLNSLELNARPHAWPAGHDDQCIYVKACLGVKSPFTVEKRANSLVHLMRWMVEYKGLLVSITEDGLWDYLSYLKEHAAAASKGQASISGIRFALHVLGVCFSEHVLSRRCIGFAEQMEALSRESCQASSLLLSELLALHGMLKNSALEPWDRASVAFLIICAYARARASDLVRVQRVSADTADKFGFLEIMLKTHKGARNPKLKSKLLPVIAPLVGVDGSNWYHDVKAALEAVGLSLDGDINGPLFRPPSDGAGGAPGVRELRAHEVTALLHSFLGQPDANRRLSSHSLKATLLDWTSKFGLPPQQQHILGRHCDAVKGSAPLYSRDLVYDATRALQSVIMEVHHARFVPDAPRSLRYPQSVAQSHVDVIEVKDEPVGEAVPIPTVGKEPEPAEHDASPASSSDVESSSSSSSSSDSDAPASCKKFARPDWPEELTRVHKKTRTMHLAKSFTGGGTAIFACGRAESDAYEAGCASGPGRRCEVCVRLGADTS